MRRRVVLFPLHLAVPLFDIVIAEWTATSATFSSFCKSMSNVLGDLGDRLPSLHPVHIFRLLESLQQQAGWARSQITLAVRRKIEACWSVRRGILSQSFRIYCFPIVHWTWRVFPKYEKRSISRKIWGAIWFSASFIIVILISFLKESYGHVTSRHVDW